MSENTESETDSNQTPDFEGSLQQLHGIVRSLESGELGLQSSIEEYERGVKLLRSCYSLLENAEQKIELLTSVDSSGNEETEPFDATATAAKGTAGKTPTGFR